MKLFRRRRKNNKGFSLVEVICAIAIMGLVSTAVGSAMIITTTNYQRGSAEVDVQKEAQATTNLIGNLLVDAVTVQSTTVGTLTTVTVDGEGKTYNLEYDSDTDVIKYKETLLGGTPVDGILAENVTDFKIAIDDDNRNAKIQLAVEKNGKHYEATYNTNSRNGQSVNAGAKAVASIIMETEVTLEPKQTYFFPITVLGTTVTGLTCNGGITEIGADSDVGGTGTTVNVTMAGASVALDPNAKGTLQFIVETNETDATTGLPLASATVTINVRSVEDISFDVQRSGESFKKDTVYRVYADAIGYNFNKVYGKNYDNDYKNPLYMNFANYTITDKDTGAAYTKTDYIENVVLVEDVDRPYFEFELKENMPNNSIIKIVTEAKHTMGMCEGTQYNKKGESYGTVTKTCEILNDKGVIWPTSGLMRGDDFFFATSLDGGTIKDAAGDVQPHWYWRYKVTGTNTWSQYYRTQDGGLPGATTKMNTDETRLLLPDVSYDFEIIIAAEDGTKLYWPQDPNLLTKAGFDTLQPAWDDTNPSTCPYLSHSNSATVFAQYGNSFSLPAAELLFRVESEWDGVDATDCIDLGISYNTYYKNFGSVGNGHNMTIGDTLQVYFDANNLKYDKHTYTVVVWKYDSGANMWDDLLATEASARFAMQYDSAGFRINQINNVPDVTGRYRFELRALTGAEGKAYATVGSYDPDTGIVYSDLTAPWGLVNTTSNTGYIYVDVY